MQFSGGASDNRLWDSSLPQLAQPHATIYLSPSVLAEVLAKFSTRSIAEIEARLTWRQPFPITPDFVHCLC
jgi:hypothetical protein